MVELTQKEKEIYRYISECLERNGYAPSVRDICAAMGIKSTSSVHEYLRRLETKGYIKKSSGKSRALSLENGKRSETARIERVPILGRVTAGQPILAVENYEGYVDFPSAMARGKANLFALRVMGESMIEAGIMDGDYVVVCRTSYVENGDIAVVIIDEEATVKTFYRENGHFRLQPENKTMKPIITSELFILGKVIACVRYYG